MNKHLLKLKEKHYSNEEVAELIREIVGCSMSACRLLAGVLATMPQWRVHKLVSALTVIAMGKRS
jgi:hypothetical protein